MKPLRVLLGAAAAASTLALAACGGGTAVGSAMLQTTAQVAAAASNPVTVSPLPGTLDASASTQVSFLGPQGTTVSAVRVRGLGERRASRRAARLLDGYRRELPARPSLRRRRARERVGARVRGGRRARRTDELRDRPPGPDQNDRIPQQPGRPQGGPALPLGPRAHAEQGHDHDTREVRREPRLPAAGALPGEGRARADDHRPERQPRLVPAAAGGTRRDEPRRPGLRGPSGARVVARARARARLRPRRRPAHGQLPTGRSRGSAPGTATARTSTSSGSHPKERPGSTRTTPCG